MKHTFMKLSVLIGRVFYSLIFVVSSFGHFSKATIGYAANQGVPFASISVPFSGLMALAGGVSVAIGYKARWGALLLVMFLVPVTIMMHNFWAIADPATAAIQRIMFMKNLSMFGAALLICHFGAGPMSVDDWAGKNHW